MRFARHARIFRGPLDAAPLAGVVFLLALFVLLTTLVYTPGAFVRLSAGETAPAGSETLLITRSNTLVFRNHIYAGAASARDALRQPPVHVVALRSEPGADQKLVDEVKTWFAVLPPPADGAPALTGADRSVMVVVNFRGQCFFDNRLVDDAQLKSGLKQRLDDARRQGKDLTLALDIDKDAPNGIFARISNLARAAGFKTMLYAEQP